MEKLSSIVLNGAIAFGFETDLWTVSRLRRVIRDEFRIQLSKNTIWRRLRDAGLTYQKPEREYYEIDEAARKNGCDTKCHKSGERSENTVQSCIFRTNRISR
ncbi:MAG: winged helix-turn-helix domain-containing protein [Planctomycetaceae bacterium]